MAYIVIKTIRGRRYKYWQRAWREGNRVRTQCRCLGRLDNEATRAASNTTTAVAAAGEPWRAELKDGLREVVRRLQQEGNHYVVDQIKQIDVATLSRTSLLKTLGDLNTDWEGDSYAGHHLTETIARLVAFGNTTADTRESWRSVLSDRLAIAETWMPSKATKDAMRTILKRLEVTDPERNISYLQNLLNNIDPVHVQACKQIEGAIEALRNTTGTHTDASLMTFLLESKPERNWQRPWRTRKAERKSAINADDRIVGAPLKLGVAVKTQPFAAKGEMSRSSGQEDGAWYSTRRDLIQIPDAARYETNTAVSAAEQFEHSILHETCHAAWHPSRLNRDWRTERVGADSYASEEVATDLAACLIERRLGRNSVALWETQADYIQSWLRRAGSSEELVRARQADAIRVADYVMARIEARCTDCNRTLPPNSGTVCFDCIPF